MIDKNHVFFSSILLLVTYFILFSVSYSANTSEQTSFSASNASSNQQCTESICEISTSSITSDNSSSSTNATSDGLKEKLEEMNIEKNQFISSFVSKNIFYFIAGFWFLGVLLAFTPCVIPLFILIIGLLSGRDGNISRKKTILLSIVYVLSLALTYTLIGVSISVFGVFLQSYLETSWVIISFAVIIALLSFSLLGFYKIKLPPPLCRFVARHQRYKTDYHIFEVALMGVFATLITSPCIAAPLAGILGMISTTNNIFFGAGTLFFIGLGLGTPLLLAAFISSQLIAKTSALQYQMKSLFGLAMLGVSVYLFSKILPNNFDMLLWSVFLLFSGSLILQLKSKKQLQAKVIIWRTIALMLMLYAASIFYGYLIGNTDPLNPLKNRYTTSSVITNFIPINSLQQLQTSIKNSSTMNKASLVLFSADWCSACKQIKETLQSNPIIQPKLHNFSLFEVDISTPGTSEYTIMSNFKISAPPEIIFFNQNGIQTSYRIIGNTSADTISSVIDRVLNEK